MGSAYFLRLIVFLLLAVAAGILFFSMGEEFDSSPSREAKGLEGEIVRPAALNVWAKGVLPSGRVAAVIRPGVAWAVL